MNRNPKVLIVGGAGFIGSHLCDRFVNEGSKIYVIDNLSTGSLENIRKHLDSGDVDYVNDYRVVNDVDVVYNLAAIPSPKDYIRRPIEVLTASAFTTYQILALAPKRFVLTSTSEVYGDPEQHPQHESYNGNVSPTGLRSCYDEGKRYAEAMTMAFLRTFKYDTRIARIFNTYGTRMRKNDGRLIPEVINRLSDGEIVEIHGDGNNRRSFCYVDDMVDGLFKMGVLDDVSPDPINIGNPHEEYRVQEVVDMIVDIMKIEEPKLAYTLPVTIDDPKRRQPDISRAKRYLGFDPKITLHSGLKKMIKHMGGME